MKNKSKKPSKKTDYFPFSDPKHFESLRSVAADFKQSLQGDFGYISSECNRVALAERLVGYISAQAWFITYRKKHEAEYPNDDVFQFAGDMASQLVEDAITIIDPKFA